MNKFVNIYVFYMARGKGIRYELVLKTPASFFSAFICSHVCFPGCD